MDREEWLEMPSEEEYIQEAIRQAQDNPRVRAEMERRAREHIRRQNQQNNGGGGSGGGGGGGSSWC